MKPLLPALLWVVLSAGMASGQPQAKVAAVKTDPAIAAWRLEDGRMLKIRDDRLAAVWTVEGTAPMMGKWELDPFSEATRRYAITWDHGTVWDLELAKDFSALRGTDKDGQKLAGLRVDELTAHFRSNDKGGFAVNGKTIFTSPTTEVQQRVFLRKGDVLTVELVKMDVNIGFLMEIFRGNQSVITAKEFRYSVAPDPDWRTSPNLFGFRLPLTTPIKNFAMGNVKEPLCAIPQKEDDGFNKLHFKYVMP